MKMLLKGGTLIDPASHREGQTDLLIDKGKVAGVGKDLSANGAKVVEVDGLWVTPGLIDMHVHFRQPGREDKETIESGSRAATKGGFTSVCPMANTEPVVDHRGLVEFILQEAQRVSLVRIYPIGAVTKGQKGEELAELGELYESGCVAFSDDGHPIQSSLVMRRALEYTGMYGLPIIVHAQDAPLFSEGVMNEGYMSTVLGLRGIPPECESIMVARDIELARLTKGRVHFAHVSTTRSLELISEAKRGKLLITCETAPHYFALTDQSLASFDANFKMNPPLRAEADVASVKRFLKEGTIDCIATDHAPHTEQEKDVELDAASFGIVGLETALGLGLTFLVQPGLLTIGELVARMSVAPSRILGLSKGSLAVGADADITVIDPKEKWTVRAEEFESKSKNSPFIGWELQGRAKMTIVAGKMVMRDERILGAE